MVTECLPIALEDLKVINTPNLIFFDPGKIQLILDEPMEDDFPESGIEAYDFSRARVPVNAAALSAAKDSLLIALRKGRIKAWGMYGDIQVENPSEFQGPNFSLSTAWNNCYEKNYVSNLFEGEGIEIPTELWAWELIDWFENILHSPLRQENLSQFSDVVVYTEDLFREFASPDFLKHLHPVERFLIPVSEAASLMATGEHNSDNSAIQDILSKKQAELLRALRNGKLYSEGRHENGYITSIDCMWWNDQSDISYNKTEHFMQVVVDENELRSMFEIPEVNRLPGENASRLNKKGRPPLVKKEIWLTELAVLFKSGSITPSDKLEVIAQALIDALRHNHNKTISLDTVRKDWLRPIFKEAKRRNGDN